MIKDSSISVIICTKDRYDDLIKCIDSLVIQTHPISELVIIDSSEKKISQNLLKRYRKKFNIKYIYYDSGLTEARNLGIKKAKGDIKFFLDDDVILDKRYISEIFRIFNKYDGDVGAATGKIMNEEIRTNKFSIVVKFKLFRELRNMFRRLFLFFSFGNGKFHPSGFPSLPFGQNKIIFIEFMQGSNMAFKKEVLKKIRFDENLHGPGPMDDCDISYRVSRRYKIIYTPYAKLVHNVSKKGGSRTQKSLWRKMVVENSYYIFKKNFPDKLYNKFAFWWSMFGLFLIFLVRDRDELKGLISGLKSVVTEKRFKYLR